MSAPKTMIELVFVHGDGGASIVVKHGDTLYSIEGLRKAGTLAMGPMETIVMNQLADKMRALALKLDDRVAMRGGVR
jgi:hypothetical protein